MKRQVSGSVFLADVKRCYVDVELTNIECPTCRNKMSIDFNDQYLMYPEIGKLTDMGLYCQQCNTDWKMPLKVSSSVVTIEYDADKIEEDVYTDE